MTVFAGVPTIRAAIFDVIDEGDDSDESEEQTEKRMRFVDLVIARIEQLQNPPHDGVKLQNLCERHKRLALPQPEGIGLCPHCEKELR